MRDHGGNLDQARAAFGAGDWIDLSTGINRRPWPLPELPAACWQALPTRAAQSALVAAACNAWGAAPGWQGLALSGAQAAIQMVPLLRAPGRARVLGPTYNEHAACLGDQGWQVSQVQDPAALAGADLAVIVNPNNPDGRSHAPQSVLDLAESVGLLVVDESFGDVWPALSLLPQAARGNVLVLRSFGKFYGLAGVRLGFAFAKEPLIARLQALAGPWPVSGPAIHLGTLALADVPWAVSMRAQLTIDSQRADDLALSAGWGVAGGTPLFRLYTVPDARLARDQLARHHIWSRIFPWSDHLLRLGLPGPEAEWSRLSDALKHRA